MRLIPEQFRAESSIFLFNKNDDNRLVVCLDHWMPELEGGMMITALFVTVSPATRVCEKNVDHGDIRLVTIVFVWYLKFFSIKSM